MRAANLAGVPLDRRRGVDDLKLVAVFEHLHVVARDHGDYGKDRPVGLPAFGAATGVVVGDIARDRDFDRLVLAFADQGAAGEVARTLFHSIINGWVDMNSHRPILLVFDILIQNTTTERIDLPSCIRSKPLLISSSLRTWVIIGSIWIFPFMYQSTIFGTSVRPRAPPNAVPFHTRPVTSWNGRVAISFPASATPMMTETPQPRWQHSSAWRITVVFPVQSKVKSAPPSVSPTRCWTMSLTLVGLTKWVMP